MSEPITPEWQYLQRRAFNLSCDDQLQLAKLIAANVGYTVIPSADSYDEPTLEDRVATLEKNSHPPYDFTHLVRLLTVTAKSTASMLVGLNPTSTQGQMRDEIHALLADQQSPSQNEGGSSNG